MGNRPKYWCKRRVRLTSMQAGQVFVTRFCYALLCIRFVLNVIKFDISKYSLLFLSCNTAMQSSTSTS
jgi:hypothetical protein